MIEEWHCGRCGGQHPEAWHSFAQRRIFVELRQGKRPLFPVPTPEQNARAEALIRDLLGLFPDLRPTYEWAKSLEGPTP